MDTILDCGRSSNEGIPLSLAILFSPLCWRNGAYSQEKEQKAGAGEKGDFEDDSRSGYDHDPLLGKRAAHFKEDSTLDGCCTYKPQKAWMQ